MPFYCFVIASDHTDHTMYLQCSWGTSVCVCEDWSRLKPLHSLHCSIHSAESQRTYSRLGKGKQCSMSFKTGEMVYSCQVLSRIIVDWPCLLFAMG